MVRKHWTSKGLDEFDFAVVSQFLNAVEVAMADGHISQADLAGRLEVSEARVSQMLSEPKNLTVRSLTRLVRAIGQKLSLVVYDDGDPDNLRGPVNNMLFTQTWELCEKPRDFWDLDAWGQAQPCAVTVPPTDWANPYKVQSAYARAGPKPVARCSEERQVVPMMATARA